MPTTVRPARRLAARVAGFAAAFVVVLAGAATAAPGAWWAPLTATGCAGAATAAHVGLIVDFGTVTDAGAVPTAAPEVRCVTFTGSDETGSDVLVAAGHRLSFNDVGLLCSIDGYPASGCGKATAAGYEYWSYWHGGSRWTYATSGPDYTRVQSGGVEGWRFVAGQDSSTEHAPRYSSAGPCPSAAPTTTVRAAKPPTAPVTGDSGGGRATTGPSVDRPGGATSSTPAGGDASTPAGGGRAGAVAGHGSYRSGQSSQSGQPGQSDDLDRPTSGTASSRALAATVSPHPGSGSGSPVAAIAIGALILALGAGAFVVSRLRAAP